MDFDHDLLFGLLAASGGGLLVGIERERRKGDGAQRGAIGLRSCTVAALAGAIAALLGDSALLLGGLGIVALAIAAYWRSGEVDPGLTTELALLATFLLGALAMAQAQLAAALFVVLALVLAGKESLHRFARQALSKQEVGDALLLAASILIVMPLLPDRAVDPLGALNPRKLWLFVVLVMSINAAGYVALRVLGPGRGLALSGFLGGFVSSTATIAGLAQRAKQSPELRPECIAGGLLSNIATIVQLAVILFAVSNDLLRRLALPLGAAGLVAVAIGGIAYRNARQRSSNDPPMLSGHAFAFRNALVFAAIVAVALLAGAALRLWLGASGAIVAAMLTGFADVHAASIALGQMVAAANLPVSDAAFGLAAAFATNSLVKCAVAVGGGGAYARPVSAGVLAMNLALFGTAWLAR